MNIIYSNKFLKSYRSLDDKTKILVKDKIAVFQKDQFNKMLKTHKLKGRFSGYYSFSINYDLRIIFDYEKKDLIRFHIIGKHDIYE